MADTQHQPVIDFVPYAEQRAGHFTGRTWVFRAVHEWLRDAKGSRFFLLTGMPGSGKTAIAARLYQFSLGTVAAPERLGHLAPHFLAAAHFCSARDGSWIDPRTFSRSIASQLATLPEYAQALKDAGDKTIHIDAQVTAGVVHDRALVAGVIINNLVLAGLNAQDAFNRSVLDPLLSIYRGGFDQPIVILVDALDESLLHKGDVTIVELLSRLENLPPKVRFILTSRHDPRVENEFREAAGLFLSAVEYENDNREDIGGYVEGRLREDEKLKEKASQLEPAQQTTLTNTVIRKSEGNFQYVAFLLDAMAKGQRSLEDPEGLPAGLDGLYHNWLENIVKLGKKDWSRDYAPLVGVLSVAQGGLTLAQLQAFVRKSERRVSDCLADLQQLVQESHLDANNSKGEEHYRLDHQSVIDFLRRRQLLADKKTLPNRFYLPPEEWHKRIAAAYVKKYAANWSGCDAYGLRYLPLHLTGASQDQQLRALLLDFRWLWVKLNATDAAALLADYSLLPSDPVLDTVYAALRLSAHVLTQDKTQLPGQLCGRLLARQEPAIRRLLEQAQAHKAAPWLRPLTLSLFPPGGPLERTIVGHSNTVNGLAVVPDGVHMISAASDHTLKVWNLQTGAVERTLTGHTSWVSAVAVTPDGARAVSASWDKTLRIWNLQTGALERTLVGHDGVVMAVAVVPKTNRAISASTDRTLKVWNLETGAAELTLTGHGAAVNAVAVTPDGSRAVSASEDRTLKVWDLQNGTLLYSLNGHTKGVAAVAITSDGQKAISASEDGSLKVWNLRDRAEAFTLIGHADAVRAVIVTPDDARVISGSSDRTVRIWNLNTRRLERTLPAHTESVKAVALIDEATRLVSASASGILRIWSLRSGSDLPGTAAHTDTIAEIAVTPDGAHAISASADRTLRVWDPRNGREERTLADHTEVVRAVCALPDNVRAVSASWDKTLKVWNLLTGIVERTLPSGNFLANAAVALADGMRVMVACQDTRLRIWNLETGKLERVLPTSHTVQVSALAITHDGIRAVTGSSDTDLKVWNVQTGAEECTLPGHTNTIVSVAVTRDGTRALSGARDGTARVWDLRRKAQEYVLEEQARRLHCCYGVAVTPDGMSAATVSEDRNVKVWDLRTGRLVAAFTGEGPMTACAVVDGVTFLAGDESGQMHFLRLEGTE